MQQQNYDISEHKLDHLYVKAARPKGEEKPYGLIFVHGAGMNYRSGEPVIYSFAERGYPAFTFSLRSHTRSRMPPGKEFYQASLDDYIADLTLLSDDLANVRGIPFERQIFIAHSAAATWVPEYLRRQQLGRKRAAALITINGEPPTALMSEYDHGEDLDDLERRLENGEHRQRSREEILRFFKGDIPRNFAGLLLGEYPISSIESIFSTLQRYRRLPFDTTESAVECPILVVSSTSDIVIVPSGLSKKVAEHYGAEYMEIDSTHLPMFDEKWPEFFSMLIEWTESKIL